MLWIWIRIDGYRVFRYASAHTLGTNGLALEKVSLRFIRQNFIPSCVFLSPGYSLCLGQSYFFRFNHPEEASRMKSMLPQKSPVSPLVYSTGKGSHIPPNTAPPPPFPMPNTSQPPTHTHHNSPLWTCLEVVSCISKSP